MLNNTENNILKHIARHGLSFSERPFLEIAQALDIEENQVIDILRDLKARSIVKNLCGVINHQNAGYKENVLVAWNVPSEKIKQIKDVLIGSPVISHCYEREPKEEFDYNIFTMMHANETGVIEAFTEKTANEHSVNFVCLPTQEELKKKKLALDEILV